MMTSMSCRGLLGLPFCILLLFPVLEVNGGSYDYSFTPECLPTPLKPQYGGGIVVNPELNEQGLKGWSNFGDAKLAKRVSKDGNSFLVAFDRNGSNHSLSQTFTLQNGIFYVISAWLRVSLGESLITAAFTTPAGISYAGKVSARSGCWSMLKGGLTANFAGVAQLHFMSENSTADIWVDSVSLQPFTEQEWSSHQIQSVEKIRKSKVRFQAVDAQGQPLTGANISIQQQNGNFPVGSAMNANILNNQAYQNWFASRFKLTVFENEMKWYSTEKSAGREDYSVPDAMLRFAKSRGINVRGHNILWDDPNFNPSWVRALSPAAFKSAVDRRIQSVVQRYRGQLIHWDVVNENLHFNFLESKLGPSASAVYYQRADQIDPRATPFLNEYNTLEQRNDAKSSPSNYLRKINEIRSQGYRGPLGIGLEGHFSTPDQAYIRASLDVLASARLPIWITELDVSGSPNQAAFLDRIMRELHAHPAVQAIVLWAAWSPRGCYRMCLTDNNFRNLATGNVVDKILGEWKQASLIGTTDANGYFETSLYHGDYEVKFNHSSGTFSSSTSIKVKVNPTTNRNILDVKLSAT